MTTTILLSAIGVLSTIIVLYIAVYKVRSLINSFQVWVSTLPTVLDTHKVNLRVMIAKRIVAGTEWCVEEKSTVTATVGVVAGMIPAPVDGDIVTLPVLRLVYKLHLIPANQSHGILYKRADGRCVFGIHEDGSWHLCSLTSGTWSESTPKRVLAALKRMDIYSIHVNVAVPEPNEP